MIEGRASRTASRPWAWPRPWSPRKEWWERPAANIPVTTAIATIVARLLAIRF
jgi:hypothetical protein